MKLDLKYLSILFTVVSFFVFQNSALTQTKAESIIQVFKNPDGDSKGMLRWWFPSANVREELIIEQVNALYNAGFGGVEVAIVPHWTEYDAAIDGWGTPKYAEMLKYILRAAKALPGDFRIDITITAHWPPSLNTLDPNDLSASKELSYAYKKVNAGKGIELPMPAIKTEDGDEQLSAEFIFKDRFVSASIAKVKSINGNTIELDFNSMKDVSNLTSKIIDPGTGQPKYTKAGIPENSTLFGNKKKMNDKQYYYQVDLNELLFEDGYQPSAGNDLNAGDWVLFGFYTRGTGQVLSGTGMMHFNYPMADRMYATDYYAKEGAQAIIDYWNEYLLSDPELLMLLIWAAGDLFEDSIENFSKGTFWTNNVLTGFREFRNYDITPYMPFIASIKGSKVNFTSSIGNASRIQQDFSLLLNEYYLENRIDAIQDWSHTFNYGYRAQAYGGEGDDSDASVLLDVAEQEGNNMFVNSTGGANITGKKFVSMETLTAGGMTYSLPWDYAIEQISGSFAAGSNRMIFHGTPYEDEPAHKYDAWPGWHAFQSMFGEPWGPRQIHWNDVNIIVDFIAYNQAVLQNGLPRVDLAFYREPNTYTQHISELLNNGYTYDVVTKLALDQVNAFVYENRLAPLGAAYKAIVLNNQDVLTIEGAEKLIKYAQKGLPVVVYGTIPDKVNGVSGEDVEALNESKVTDKQLQAKVKELMALNNVVYVKDQSDLIPSLKKLGVYPSASFAKDGVRNIHRKDFDGTNYYYLFNVGEKLAEFEVSLEGQGTPYVLNAWTGEITPFALSKKTNNGIETTLRLGAKESTIIAITQNTDAFANPLSYHVSDCNMEVKVVDGKAMGIAEKTGKYQYKINEGDAKTATIKSIGEKIILPEWDLTIESWGPGEVPDRPTVSKKTSIEVGKTQLKTWNKLDVSLSELTKAEVDSMGQVSGIGYYSTTFDINQNWTGGYNAYLTFEHGEDMVTAVTVNGKTITAIDPTQNKVDIGGYLIKGSNEIKIKLVTTFINRVKAENELFAQGSTFPGPEGAPGRPEGDRPPGMSGMPEGGMPLGGGPEGMPMRMQENVFGASGIGGSRGRSPETVYGLTKIEIILYGQVELK